MWTAKISFDGRKAAIGSKALKHKVNLFGFPLSYFYQKKWIFVNVAGIIIGEEKNKKKFIKDWKKSGRLANLELNGDFLIGTIKEPTIAKTIYNKDIIHLAPVLIDENGREIIDVGAFNKKVLDKLILTLERLYETKILYIKERKVKNISIVKENPELTDKQRKAIELAIKNGYYNVPRKISVEELAKLSNLSFSTFQVHLRKAEQKLIPFYYS